MFTGRNKKIIILENEFWTPSQMGMTINLHFSNHQNYALTGSEEIWWSERKNHFTLRKITCSIELIKESQKLFPYTFEIAELWKSKVICKRENNEMWEGKDVWNLSSQSWLFQKEAIDLSLSRDFRMNGRRAVEEMFSYAFTNKNTRVIQHSFNGLKLEAGHFVV